MEYFFPYKYLTDIKWDQTLHDMIPSFIDAKTETEFYTCMQKLTVRLNDSHVVFVKYPTKKYFLPIIGKIIDEKIIITEILNPALQTDYNVTIGDVITKINNKTVKEHIAENRELVSASNDAYYLRNIIEPILSGKGETITLEFVKDNQTITKTINWTDYTFNRFMSKELKRGIIHDKFKILKNNIGLVNMGSLKQKDVPAMIESLKNTKAIVFDMRNYPNGTFEDIANFLNSEEKTFAIYTKPDLTYPGRFVWKGSSTCGSKNTNNYKGKVIVLLNEDSISQSEWTAMCFQTAGQTTIIGSQTAGADGNVSMVDYMPAFHSQFTGKGVYYPDRRETQRIGIMPDVEIKPTLKGLIAGKDEVLERAIQFIENGK